MAITNLDEDYRPPLHLRSCVRSICERIVKIMQENAYSLGWTVAVHGSMERDLDVIAIPWAKEACDEISFINVMRHVISKDLEGTCHLQGHVEDQIPKPELKDHNRRCYTFHMNSTLLIHSAAGAHPYIDLNIIDRRQEDAL